MTNAAMTPGTQPQKVKSRTIRKDPQPFPITASGGKKIANNTRKKLILIWFYWLMMYIYDDKHSNLLHISTRNIQELSLYILLSTLALKQTKCQAHNFILYDV